MIFYCRCFSDYIIARAGLIQRAASRHSLLISIKQLHIVAQQQWADWNTHKCVFFSCRISKISLKYLWRVVEKPVDASLGRRKHHLSLFAEFVHECKDYISDEKESPAGRRHCLRFSLVLLWNICSAHIASAWLTELMTLPHDSWSKAGGPPVSGRLALAPLGTRPCCLKTMDLYWLLWLCHLLNHKPCCSHSSSPRELVAAAGSSFRGYWFLAKE